MIIIDRLSPHPVDYLLEKFLNVMQNKKLNVEVRTERAHKTMVILEERYRNSDKEPIHFQLLIVQRYQALLYYGQQGQVDALFRADKQPDGSEGHLSDIEHATFHTMSEANIRAASKMRGNSCECRTSVKTHRQPSKMRITLPLLTNGINRTTVHPPKTSQWVRYKRRRGHVKSVHVPTVW
ncbi:hypothetical protein SARC_09747 [Sphaeroforma arctica JP610]|uniref:Uncharacterized protein n=1 Tax=Sphaeroforma arctica JP610 TaxID=667725 RepID=A0A0L0FLZ1_9EUKA|nr:hypothetical protein SARC_09747 [Sphaeroforma arctica JP610]KNC77799.1 hypothetical protein SARC_09747 [Sphaeroforma arctica JP610]|eukprot:XP_014151701.1 hypothetical protein SARC_09747 [Sphaeroforma arctica JP610]